MNTNPNASMKHFQEPTIVTATMECWNDITSFNQLFLSNYIFRGQADSEWGLEPSLERLVKRHHPNYKDKNIPSIYEHKMLKEFKYKYPLYEINVHPKENENLEWLTLMQHFGTPTRLLDFTNSLFVALYMALDGSFSDSSAIWAINKLATEREHIKTYMSTNAIHSTPKRVIDTYIRDKANSVIGMSRTSSVEKEIFPVYPQLCNERVSIQQGLFLMASDLDVTFTEVFDSFYRIENNIEVPIKELLNYSYSVAKFTGWPNLVLFKIIIPKKFKWELTQLLNQMNITAETLYPGLGGLAKSLSSLQLRDSDIYTE